MLRTSQELRITAFIEHVRQDIHTRMYQGQMRYAGDLKTLEWHIRMAREIGDMRLVGRLYLTLAMAHEFAGYFTEAIEVYDLAYETFAGADDPLYMAKARNNLAELHRLAGQFDLALKAYDEACRLVERSSEKNLLPLIESNIGLTWLALGDYRHAEAHFLDVIRLTVKEGIENTDALMEAHRGLGEVYLAQQLYAEAWQHVNLALELAQGMEDIITAAEINLLRARLAETDVNRPKSPQFYYQLSREQLTVQNAPTVLARSLLEEARYHQRRGDIVQARDLARQAYPLLEQANMQEEKQIAAALIA